MFEIKIMLSSKKTQSTPIAPVFARCDTGGLTKALYNKSFCFNFVNKLVNHFELFPTQLLILTEIDKMFHNKPTKNIFHIPFFMLFC